MLPPPQLRERIGLPLLHWRLIHPLHRQAASGTFHVHQLSRIGRIATDCMHGRHRLIDHAPHDDCSDSKHRALAPPYTYQGDTTSRPQASRREGDQHVQLHRTAHAHQECRQRKRMGCHPCRSRTPYRSTLVRAWHRKSDSALDGAPAPLVAGGEGMALHDLRLAQDGWPPQHGCQGS